MRRTVILALLFSSCASSQTAARALDSTARTAMDYVPDSPATRYLLNSLNSRVKVDASQLSTASGLTCSYRVTNGSDEPIFLLMVGETSLDYTLPVPPLHWNQPNAGATPAGWFETMGSKAGRYSMGWQARTSKDLIQPGGSADFSFDLPASDTFQCGAAGWRVNFAKVYPILDFPPTEISLTLSHLQVATARQFEGDVSIRNLGPNDAILNLGVSLGNGQTHPERLELVARGPDGREYRLHSPPFYVAGRIYALVARIPKGGTYAIHVQWWELTQPPTDTYTFHVEFEGVQGRGTSPEMEEVSALRYWLGKVSSNEVSLKVP